MLPWLLSDLVDFSVVSIVKIIYFYLIESARMFSFKNDIF